MIKYILKILIFSFIVSIFNGCSLYTLVYDDTPEYRQKFYSQNIYGYVNKKKYFESKDIEEYLETRKDRFKKPLNDYINYTKKHLNDLDEKK